MLSFQELFDLCTLSYEDLGNQRLIYRFSKPPPVRPRAASA